MARNGVFQCKKYAVRVSESVVREIIPDVEIIGWKPLLYWIKTGSSFAKSVDGIYILLAELPKKLW